MLPTKTPGLLKKLYPSLVWEKRDSGKSVYLTFDDGPHPEITPWVLNVLKETDCKATFFCIGDNVRKFPETFQKILEDGHRVGNHTFNHLKGFKTKNTAYFQNIEDCGKLVQSQLFRPPYGQITKSQIEHLKTKYSIIMWTLLVEDWNPQLDTSAKLNTLKKNTECGDIIVFHDSEKAFKNVKLILRDYIDFIKLSGYETKLI